MRRHYSFSVPFVMGKGRPKFGKGHAYTPAATERAEREVARAFEQAADEQTPGRDPMAPNGVPVRVAVATERDVLSRWPKRAGDTHPDTQKPDLDNVVKLVLDGLNGHAWEDDAQVTDLHVIKTDRTRGAEARTIVNVEWEDR